MKKTVLVLSAMVSLLVISGCYRPSWHRENTTYAELKTDSEWCKGQTKIGATREEVIEQYEKCMMDKGYMPKPPNQTVSPSIPSDVQIVQPAPSLPKELVAFLGKWEGKTGRVEFFLIVENIDEEKASLYTWRSGSDWVRYEAKVTKERGKYKLWFRGRLGVTELTLSGEYLDADVPRIGTLRSRRVR